MFLLVVGLQCVHSTFFGLFHDNVYEVWIVYLPDIKIYSVILVQLFISLAIVGNLFLAPTPWAPYSYILLTYGIH